MLFNAQDNISAEGNRPIPKTVFIWLDILGFADALETEARFQELASILESFQAKFDIIDGCHTKIISDGIILRIIDPTVALLKQVFREIGEKQLEFILKHKEFIRGGISIGSKLSGDDGQDGTHNLISQGLARAAKLEGTSVDWPIIAINQKYLKEINEYFRTDGSEHFGLRPYFNRKGEKLYFIDFLESPDSDYCAILNDKIYDFRGAPSIHSKYIWLLRYLLDKFEGIEKDIRLTNEVIL